MGNFGQANYATAKAGMIGFTKSAALEFARKGITVNCVAPGYTETEMVASVPKEALERVISRIPMGRLGTTDEMARGRPGAQAFLRARLNPTLACSFGAQCQHVTYHNVVLPTHHVLGPAEAGRT
jgi:NAD(P)-dependent dehydrogenase (short-subunit alcohol dehydrogenase family)